MEVSGIQLLAKLLPDQTNLRQYEYVKLRHQYRRINTFCVESNSAQKSTQSMSTTGKERVHYFHTFNRGVRSKNSYPLLQPKSVIRV